MSKICIFILLLPLIGPGLFSQNPLIDIVEKSSPTKSEIDSTITIPVEGLDNNLQPNISRAEFIDSVDKKGVQFYEEIKFKWAMFLLETDFSGAWFHSGVSFHNATFKSKAFLRRTHFKSISDFSMVDFDSAAVFSGAFFYSTAHFSGVQFNSEANFSMAHFDSVAHFSNTRFDSIANFSFTYFDSIADFSGAHFKSGITMTYLPKYLDLSHTIVQNEYLDFYNSKVDSSQKYCLVNLINADIKDIKLRYQKFKLYFPENTSWGVKENVYTLLLNQTRMHGYLVSYELLDKEYRQAKYLNGNERAKLMMNYLDRVWWGYGYKKENILRNALMMFFFFSFINLFFINNLLLKVYNIEKIRTALTNPQNSGIKQIIFRFYYTLLYTGFVFFGVKFTTENLNYSKKLSLGNIFGIAYFIFMYIMGLICLGYITNYVITV